MGVDVVGGWTCGLSILELRHVTEELISCWVFKGHLVPEVSEVSETLMWVITSIAMP